MSVESSRARVFLCLFSGLRIPTVLRLARRSRTICFKPVSYFNPQLFEPVTSSYIASRYSEILGDQPGGCRCVVEATDEEVVRELRSLSDGQRGHQRDAQRLIFHYFGQGATDPNRKSLAFFLKDRSRFKLLDIAKIVQLVSGPVLLILDVGSAGSLADSIWNLAVSRDVIAFMAARADEKLPFGPSYPLDILSSSILSRYDTVTWFSTRHAHFSKRAVPECTADLMAFLNVVLEAVAVSKFSATDYERFFCADEALAEITRGFILATRILAFYNVHTCSEPELPPTDESEAWGYWDLFFDTVLADDLCDAAAIVFPQLCASFTNFPTHYGVRLLAFFLGDSRCADRSLDLIFQFLEAGGESLPRGLNFVVMQAVIHMEKLDAKRFLVLARLIMGEVNDFDVADIQRHLFDAVPGNDPPVLKAICAAACVGWREFAVPPTVRDAFLQLARERAADAAPFSALLFGEVAYRSQLMKSNPLAFEAFAPLAGDHSPDVRAAAAFALGVTRDIRAVPVLAGLLGDASDLVATEAVMALSMALRFDSTRFKLEDPVVDNLRGQIDAIAGRQAKCVQRVFEGHAPGFRAFLAKIDGTPLGTQPPILKDLPTSRLLIRLRKSIRMTGLLERFQERVFTGYKQPT